MKATRLLLLGTVLAGSLSAADKINQRESNAIGVMRSINTAEVYYAKAYTDRGFACSLDPLLVGPAPATASADHAGLLDNSLADPKARRYTFTVRCRDDNKPSKTYESWAMPLDKGTRAICSDETAVVRWVTKKADSCANSGDPI